MSKQAKSFTSDADILAKSGIKVGKRKVKKRTATLSQIGSIQDTMQNEANIEGTVSGISRSEK